jgi:hypothetical protein
MKIEQEQSIRPMVKTAPSFQIPAAVRPISPSATPVAKAPVAPAPVASAPVAPAPVAPAPVAPAPVAPAPVAPAAKFAPAPAKSAPAPAKSAPAPAAKSAPADTQVGSTTTTATSGSASGEKEVNKDKSDFWSLKNPFHYTVIAGAIIGFFYAKNKAKNILASTLIGAGIGGGLGIVANKFMGKKTTTSTKSSGVGSGSSDKVTDDKLIDAMINSMRQMVVSLAVTFGQDKAKAEADFNTDFEKQKPQVIAKGKEVLATMKDNEKQAVYEMILFETDLYSKAKTQEDAEKIESQLNSKIQELSTKYSVDLKAAIDKLKGQKF